MAGMNPACKYSEAEYKTALSHKLSDTYGITPAKAAAFIYKVTPNRPSKFFGINETQCATYLKIFEEKGISAALIACIVRSEGAANPDQYNGTDWINHFLTGDYTAMQALNVDIPVIKNTASKNIPPFDPNAINGWPLDSGITHADIVNFKTSLGADSVGWYYTVQTGAGQNCMWSGNYVIDRWGHYGNPYDNLIDYISEMGGNMLDPASGNSTDEKGDDATQDPQATPKAEYKRIKPGLFYNRGLEYVQMLGQDFTLIRNKDFLALQYNFSGGDSRDTAAENSGSASGEATGDIGDLSTARQKILARLASLNKTMFKYEMDRPCYAPLTQQGTDCSGAVSWLLQDVYPQLWNNGWAGSTLTIFSFFRARKAEVFSGTKSQLLAFIAAGNLEPCDVILMAKNSSAPVAGGSSHVILCETGGTGATIFSNGSSYHQYYDYPASTYIANSSRTHFWVERIK